MNNRIHIISNAMKYTYYVLMLRKDKYFDSIMHTYAGGKIGAIEYEYCLLYLDLNRISPYIRKRYIDYMNNLIYERLLNEYE